MPPDSCLELLRAARAGDADAAGRLLQNYRSYLRLVADAQIGQALAVRVDASDAIQETFLEAHRDIHGFQGETSPELLAWLRKILCRNLVDLMRHHGAQRRDWRRDGSLDAMLERSSAAINEAIHANIDTPGHLVMRREEEVHFAAVLEKLKPEYREVIVLRNLAGLSHAQVAERMGKSVGAVRMLWTRALEALNSAMNSPQ